MPATFRIPPTHLYSRSGAIQASDPDQAKQYTQQAVGLLKEHAGNDPQSLSSLLGGFMGAGGSGKGGISGLVGGFLEGGGAEAKPKSAGK
ncbi:MAG: hypothetical protein ABI347_08675 [Nitrososphaera sp.]